MSTIAKSITKSIASMDTSKIGSGKGSKSDKSDDSKSGNSGKRSESGRISQEKKDELAKTAAEKGSVGISAIANILKNNEDQ